MKKKIIVVIVVLFVVVFFVWRFLKPMNIFVVSESFERPIHHEKIPAPLASLSAKECGNCHREIYNEWKTSIHSQAWTDPYFQVDFRFDGSQQICKNCHIPLENQQKDLVLGFRDKEKWKPVLELNPNFDLQLQQEGINCAVCHVQDGAILGPTGKQEAPHPVKKMEDADQICAKCHVVQGDRWDTFFRLPPCGTVAEIELSGGKEPLNCVQCHMPSVNRAIVTGGMIRLSHHHWWRGGHDLTMVKSALRAEFKEISLTGANKRRYVLSLVNVGAAHYFPTGTPDRHLSVVFRVVGQDDKLLKKKTYILRRTVLWRPFIIDLWDTRLPKGEQRNYSITFLIGGKENPKFVETVVRYHLLDEKRRKEIAYKNEKPISYTIFSKRIFVKP